VPKARSRPHDPAFAPDGSVWYTRQMASVLGRFDPQTNQFKEYPLKTPSPAGTSGSPQTSNDPKTGKISEWPSPGGPRSSPYAITAGGNVIWYSESTTKPNTVVRFDTKTEKFQTWIIPSGGGVVRNMVSTPDGNLWLACSGANGIACVEVKDSAKVASRHGLAELTRSSATPGIAATAPHRNLARPCSRWVGRRAVGQARSGPCAWDLFQRARYAAW
jgi:streptogramin lyase